MLEFVSLLTCIVQVTWYCFVHESNRQPWTSKRWIFYESDEKVKPSGARILSCTTLFATSPPRSRAIAPTMAYNEVMRTVSIPEPWRLSACGLLVVFRSRVHSRHTLFGVHRVTLSRPYRSAICDKRDLFSTKPSASSVKPWRPFNAGCR